MSNPKENSTGSNQDPFAHFHESVTKDQDLKEMITRKALDLPKKDDPLNIDNSRTYHGEHTIVSIIKTALLAAGIGGAGLAALQYLPPDAQPSQSQAVDTNTHYELRFDD